MSMKMNWIFSGADDRKRADWWQEAAKELLYYVNHHVHCLDDVGNPCSCGIEKLLDEIQKAAS